MSDTILRADARMVLGRVLRQDALDDLFNHPDGRALFMSEPDWIPPLRILHVSKDVVVTIDRQEIPTLEHARKLVLERYGSRLATRGFERLDVIDGRGFVLEVYRVA